MRTGDSLRYLSITESSASQVYDFLDDRSFLWIRYLDSIDDIESEGTATASPDDSLAVDLFSIAEFDYQYAQGAVLDVADDSVVSNPVAPEGAQHWARQRLSGGSWVV